MSEFQVSIQFDGWTEGALDAWIVVKEAVYNLKRMRNIFGGGRKLKSVP